MFREHAFAFGLLLGLLGPHVAAIDATRDPALNVNLSTATTQLDRLALIPDSDDWKFDFTIQAPYYNWAPGGVTNMNAATLPAAGQNGLTLAMINLAPCAMLPPHFHPRAANWVVSTVGTTTTFMFEENGAHTIKTVLKFGQATIFPRGSIHMMYNDACTNAQLVSALDNPDAGTTNLANIFTNGFPFDWVNAAFGSDLASEETAARVVPVGTGANWGSAACLARCGITPNATTSEGHSGNRRQQS